MLLEKVHAAGYGFSLRSVHILHLPLQKRRICSILEILQVELPQLQGQPGLVVMSVYSLCILESNNF